MTFQFNGTLRYRFRLSLFGHDLFVGPWNSQTVQISEPIPTTGTSLPLIDGFTASFQTSETGATVQLEWEGLPLLSDKIALAGSLPISLQPLKGVILSGAASLAA